MTAVGTRSTSGLAPACAARTRAYHTHRATATANADREAAEHRRADRGELVVAKERRAEDDVALGEVARVDANVAKWRERRDATALIVCQQSSAHLTREENAALATHREPHAVHDWTDSAQGWTR